MAELQEGWRIKGRGSVTNPTGRFEATSTVPFDDGWGSVEQEEPESVQTVLHPETSRTIISTNTSPDIPFEQSINPYQGCEHGCTYCYARPSHAYWNLSPGIDFERHIFYKPNGPALLEAALRKKRYVPKVIALGMNTDCYQPSERKLKLTRQLLEVLWRYRHPVGLITKSNLVLRDIDILGPMAEAGLVKVMVSITTLDGSIARKMEPRAASPQQRLKALAGLSQAGVTVGVMAAPMILGLTDPDLEGILEAAAEAGAVSAGYTLLRLPNEVKETFLPWLKAHFPNAAPRVIARIRDSRGGQLNVARFGERMRGSGIYSQLLSKRFEVACRRLGLNKDGFKLDTSQFKVPPGVGDQMGLFG